MEAKSSMKVRDEGRSIRIERDSAVLSGGPLGLRFWGRRRAQSQRGMHHALSQERRVSEMGVITFCSRELQNPEGGGDTNSPV
jgi:hypothetical protein